MGLVFWECSLERHHPHAREEVQEPMQKGPTTKASGQQPQLTSNQ